MPTTKNPSNNHAAIERHYSLEELSERWKKVVPWIEDNIRRFQFRRVVRRSEGDGLTDHYFFDLAIWPHGEKLSGYHSGNFDCAMDTFIDPRKIREGFTWSRKHCSLFIPEDEVIIFEQSHGLCPVEQPPPPSSDFRWIKSKHLRIALETYYALYENNELVPGRGHTEQIAGYLTTRYPDLSKEMRGRITTLVNRNPKGGAPRQ